MGELNAIGVREHRLTVDRKKEFIIMPRVEVAEGNHGIQLEHSMSQNVKCSLPIVGLPEDPGFARLPPANWGMTCFRHL